MLPQPLQSIHEQCDVRQVQELSRNLYSCVSYVFTCGAPHLGNSPSPGYSPVTVLYKLMLADSSVAAFK